MDDLNEVGYTNILAGSYTVTKEAWKNEVLEIRLDVASPGVTEDKEFTCIVSTPGQVDQTTIGKLNTYGNSSMILVI